MSLVGRSENGHFSAGNKIAKGRPLGAKNQLTNIMKAMTDKGYTAGQALVNIASNTDDEYSAELIAKADSKLLDAVVKLAPSETPEPVDLMSPSELDNRIAELLTIALPNEDFLVVPKAEFMCWKAAING
ncbi:hypothetical protein [Vibrio sp. FF145]|uniref:hypothetical protein n=1 Tax=Vibrio sp. FF145 TaxID=3230013 RepID=UPI00352BD71F